MIFIKQRRLLALGCLRLMSCVTESGIDCLEMPPRPPPLLALVRSLFHPFEERRDEGLCATSGATFFSTFLSVGSLDGMSSMHNVRK